MIMTRMHLAALAATLMIGAGFAADRVDAFPAEVDCSIGNLSGSDACISPVPGGPGSNVNVEQMNGYIYSGGTPTGAFGLTNWVQVADIPGVSGSSLSDGILSMTKTGAGEWTSGTWSLSAVTPGVVYALALKGGTDNAVYRLISGIVAGTAYAWDDDDLGGALSNAALFADFSKVPLPAAVWSLLAGLAGFAGLRWRQRRAA